MEYLIIFFISQNSVLLNEQRHVIKLEKLYKYQGILFKLLKSPRNEPNLARTKIVLIFFTRSRFC